MGGCNTKERGFKVFKAEEECGDGEARKEEDGSLVREQGFCRSASMFTMQGGKGVNQDAMTVWENFAGEKDVIFCSVFDGHGPWGHKVARHVKDALPLKLLTHLKTKDDDDPEDCGVGDGVCKKDHYIWKSGMLKAYKEVDEELNCNPTIDSFVSGSTAVSVLKNGDCLMISNLGDSRALLCTRDHRNKLVPVQLTVDLKPNVPGEAQRIKNHKGRIFALRDEPEVYRLWLPDAAYPGLAMARAFGDFCVKSFGLISVPQISYRKITAKDEFVVLATDGVWDVLSNKEVINIVASAKKRSMAAKILVQHAVQAWKTKYPNSKSDDCAAICLFLNLPSSNKTPSSRKTSNGEESQQSESHSSKKKNKNTNTGDKKMTISDILPEKEEWNALDGTTRVNSLLKIPRFLSFNKMEFNTVTNEEESYSFS